MPEAIPVALPVYQQVFSMQARTEITDPLIRNVQCALTSISAGSSVAALPAPVATRMTVGQRMPARGSVLYRHDWRTVFDSICAALGLLTMAPLFAMIAFAIKIGDSGPVFYSHVRIGRNFKKFRLYKFRSMISSNVEGSTVTSPQDARVTPVGAFLRRFKLDELPQLINVLLGDMQLVGARPQMEKFVKIFCDEYGELLESRPGITDLASLIFRDEAKFFYEGSIEEQYVKRIMPIKLEMSLKYARSRTFFSDMDIILRTILCLPCPRKAWEDTPFDPARHAYPEIIYRKPS
jgi:lipopolysaccharide/colanic/teichoic acid biosynthesis glycosyltransferase